MLYIRLWGDVWLYGVICCVVLCCDVLNWYTLFYVILWCVIFVYVVIYSFVLFSVVMLCYNMLIIRFLKVFLNMFNSFNSPLIIFNNIHASTFRYKLLLFSLFETLSLEKILWYKRYDKWWLKYCYQLLHSDYKEQVLER